MTFRTMRKPATYAIQYRRGETRFHRFFVGSPGELTVDTEKLELFVHDGVTPGGHLVRDVAVNADGEIVGPKTER